MVGALSEKLVQPAIRDHNVSYCPTMDLLALATADGQCHCFRLNGQEVFKVNNRKKPNDCNHIRWKPDGRMLAVVHGKSEVCLINSHTGKQVHAIDHSRYSQSSICCLGWGATFIEQRTLDHRLQDLSKNISIDDIISRNPQVASEDIPSDLPLDLASTNIESILPKLSPLSSGGLDEDVFSTRASLDSLLDAPSGSITDVADVFVVGFDDGAIHLSMYDLFEIGYFYLPNSQGLIKPKPIAHCCHPLSTTHILLVSGTQELQLIPFDLRLIYDAGRYLSIVASKSTQLKHILRYLLQVQRQIYTDFKSMQSLPQKFIDLAEEALKERHDFTWEQAAYHLALTGDCPAALKEWLVDQVGDRGYKRWEKSTSSGYENIRRLTHEHLIPALERCFIILSRLRGLSRSHTSNGSLDLSTQDVNKALDCIGCLQLVAHHVLRISNIELQQFEAFKVWLHQEIDIQSRDSGHTDSLEKSPSIDHARTLEYISGASRRSQLMEILKTSADSKDHAQLDLKADGHSLFALFKSETVEIVTKNAWPLLPGLESLMMHLDGLCKEIFSKIAQTQRRNVRFGSPITLGGYGWKCMDTRMLPDVRDPMNLYQFDLLKRGWQQPDNPNGMILFTLMKELDKHANVELCKVPIEIHKGISSISYVDRVVLKTKNWIITDAKFIDDHEMLLVMNADSVTHLLRIHFRQLEAENGLLFYNRDAQTENATHILDLTNAVHMENFTWMTFSHSVSWIPERVEVNGRRGRRAICITSRDGHHYGVYDLDSNIDGTDPGVDREGSEMIET